jgi:hypothetical protein
MSAAANMPHNQQQQPQPHLRAVSSGDVNARAATLRTSWSADELMAMHFPDPRWAVLGILAEGVSLLAGPPKVGKSWLSLGLGLVVADGGNAFGSIAVQRGPVLYLALEDTPRRLKTRMGKILNGRPAPAGLTLATACPPMPQGGDEAIAAWLERNQDARLVVIDVFAKMRGRSPTGMSAYDADYAAVGRAKRLADKYGVAIVLVHHVRKASADDFLAEVSGTNGLAGAADATLVLKRPRGRADGILHVTGRDVDEAEYAMAFEPACGAWRLLDGPVDEHALSDTRAAILCFVRSNPASGPKAIAEGTGLSNDNVKKACQRMVADGQLCVDADGRYRAPGAQPIGTVPAVPPVPGVSQTALIGLDGSNDRGHPGDSVVPGTTSRPNHEESK